MARKPRTPPVKPLFVEPIEEVDEVTEQHDKPTLAEAVREIHGDAASPVEGVPTRDWFKTEFDTKSAAIRYAKFTLKMEVKDIAKHLDIRYQQVRNVLTNNIKRGVNEPYVPKSQRTSPDLTGQIQPKNPSGNPSGKPSSLSDRDATVKPSGSSS